MKAIITVLSLLFGLETMASITCYTPRDLKKVHINLEDKKVAILNVEEKELRAKRQLASIHQKKAFESLEFNKQLFLEGRKHRVHIENVKAFNTQDDYMTIQDQEGHVMTYTLNCESSSTSKI